MSKRSHGEGTIVKRADGRWVGAVTLPDGGRKWVYGKTQQDVARRIAAVRRDRDGGLPVVSERRTVGNYLESWLEMAKPSLRPGTLGKYTWHCRSYIIPTLGKVALAKLTAEHVQRLLAQRLAEGLAPSTVRDTHAVLRNALNEAVRLGLIPRNVALLVRKPRAPRIEMKCWDPEETERFFGAAEGDRLYALYVVALTTGLREGELLALRWRDVTLPGQSAPGDRGGQADGTIRVQHTLHWRDGVLSLDEVKTASSRRQIQLSSFAADALRQHRQRQLEERMKLGPMWRDHDLVFCTTIGGAIHASNFRRQSFLPLIRAAGVPRIRPYDMRHTAATLCLLRGVNPKVVSEMLGHSSVAITLTIYSHVLPMIQRDSAAVMDDLFGGRKRASDR